MKYKKIWGTGIIAASMLLLAACSNSNSSSSNSKDVMETATPNEISTLDSSKYGDTTSSEVLQNSMEGLYRFNKKNQPELAGATHVTRSADQKVYTFDLRKDSKWSNGDPVTAQDYVTAWRRTVDPKNSSLDSDSFAIIKNGDKIPQGKAPVNSLGVKALGKYKLQVTLENPIPYLPQILEGAQFYPQDTKLVKKLGSKYGTSSKNLVYNGPFIVKGWTGSNLKWSLVKNKTYWNKKIVKINQVNEQVVKETSTGVNLFRSNSLDYTPLSSEYVKEYQSNKDYHSQVTPTNGYMTFNLKRKVTGNVHVRRAISQAINKESLVKTVLHAGKVSNGIVAADFIKDAATGKDYRQDAGDLVTYNVKQAQKEWKLAQKQLGKKKITIELLTSDIDDSKRVGEFIQSDLMKNLPGLNLKVRSIPLKSRLASTTNHDYDVVYGTWQPSYEDPIDFLTVGGLFNLAPDYHNDNFWNQIKLAQSTYATNPKKRLAALINAETQLVKKDAFAVPLYQAGASYLLKSDIKGFQLSPYGNVAYYWNVEKS
ncbi:oligopeptide transport system substrate-binding protein [Lactobacillus colini]|uniref:Oligopeptide transport system substrate-binding protein n=1 Tax=Lactobacillus colini TaxID=1819254 RepID=A0ABS4ME16_9LACO|nr:peptide ABC transporter substrate-binding protein [Lactobacillus colini]MBP2057939.1 oligopeptide transport system substrate-binding protein [Lactobacillus colini]